MAEHRPLSGSGSAGCALPLPRPGVPIRHARRGSRRLHALSPQACPAGAGAKRKALVRTNLLGRRFMADRRIVVFPVYAGSPKAASKKRMAGIKPWQIARAPAVSDRTPRLHRSRPASRMRHRYGRWAGRANPPSPSAQSRTEVPKTNSVPEPTAPEPAHIKGRLRLVTPPGAFFASRRRDLGDSPWQSRRVGLKRRRQPRPCPRPDRRPPRPPAPPSRAPQPPLRPPDGGNRCG